MEETPERSDRGGVEEHDAARFDGHLREGRAREAERGQPLPPERGDSLWWLVAPLAIWAAHFGGCYALVAVGCPRLPERVVHLGFAGLTAAALIPLVALGIVRWRRWSRVAVEPPDAGTPASRHQFVSLATLLLAVLSALAVLYTAAGAALVGGCP